ncbi:hypothetical protein [Lunatimonas salinarum]|uniref:hypothetical protein n=1 Tax=Lunatimonas salinarum TaxID=1774590 RepID=UPI001AE0E883|nr:hypothetical protein [Lunatimonas salinarum]
MNERKLSELQKEYRAFFSGKMELYGVKSPAQLSKEKKSEFFTEIKQDWAKHKLEKQRLKEVKKRTLSVVKEPVEVYKKINKEASPIKQSTGQEHKAKQPRNKSQQPTGKITPRQEDESPREFTKQIIKSEPNQEQTDDLRILFEPNSHFAQDEQYLYPVVKMPKSKAILKLPRNGRSNQKGYKENDFYNQLIHNITGIEMTNNVHMVIPNFNKPYEPDIVLFEKKLNLYIDIEIDEPYDGYYRYPTHFINPEDEIKEDNTRDLFFTESGWIVIRFTEKQVHSQAYECIDYVNNVLNSIYNRNFSTDTTCFRENQWDYNQCIQLQKIYYREKYLGIERFQKQYSYKEIQIDITETESIENVIQRTKKFKFDAWNSSIAFDEQSHKYIHPKDETGNAEYISVTTLIERFFPFDLKRYIERKAEEENRTEEDVLDEYLLMRDEAAEKGTYLHNQIECFLKQDKFDSDSKEFELFLNFYNKEIKPINLLFFDAERMIFSDKYNVAGTIDCLFKKESKDEYVMLDWKRSKKLIIDGRPRIFGYGYALSELSSLDNSSFNRYCLQQNIYKLIAETEYGMKISSMKLVVLHENYTDYHVVDVPIMKKEANIILNSLKVKI